jgi:hypothetical protein
MHRLLAAVLRVEAGHEGVHVVTVVGVAEPLDHLGRHATSRSRRPTRVLSLPREASREGSASRMAEPQPAADLAGNRRQGPHTWSVGKLDPWPLGRDAAMVTVRWRWRILGDVVHA